MEESDKKQARSCHFRGCYILNCWSHSNLYLSESSISSVVHFRSAGLRKQWLKESSFINTYSQCAIEFFTVHFGDARPKGWSSGSLGWTVTVTRHRNYWLIWSNLIMHICAVINKVTEEPAFAWWIKDEDVLRRQTESSPRSSKETANALTSSESRAQGCQRYLTVGHFWRRDSAFTKKFFNRTWSNSFWATRCSITTSSQPFASIVAEQLSSCYSR